MSASLQRLHDQCDQFSVIVSQCQAKWDTSTPCEGWTIRDVISHVIDTQRDFLERMDCGIDSPSTEMTPGERWEEHRTAVLSRLSEPGVMDRNYDGYFGPTTIGETMTDFYGWDLIIHGGDIARATGQTWTLNDEEAARLLTVAENFGPALRSEGICAQPLPTKDDANATDRLLAYLGRDPEWQPDAC